VTFSQEKYQLKLSHEKYLIFFISLSIVVGWWFSHSYGLFHNPN
jgi:hypothetical protein